MNVIGLGFNKTKELYERRRIKMNTIRYRVIFDVKGLENSTFNKMMVLLRNDTSIIQA